MRPGVSLRGSQLLGYKTLYGQAHMARNPGRPLAVSQQGAEAPTLAAQEELKAAHTRTHARQPGSTALPVTR